jgi:hypothetical protein
LYCVIRAIASACLTNSDGIGSGDLEKIRPKLPGLLEIDLGKLLPVVVAHGTMHCGVHLAGTMLPNSRTTPCTSITGKSGAPRYGEPQQ